MGESLFWHKLEKWGWQRPSAFLQVLCSCVMACVDSYRESPWIPPESHHWFSWDSQCCWCHPWSWVVDTAVRVTAVDRLLHGKGLFGKEGKWTGIGTWLCTERDGVQTPAYIVTFLWVALQYRNISTDRHESYKKNQIFFHNNWKQLDSWKMTQKSQGSSGVTNQLKSGFFFFEEGLGNWSKN